MTLFYNTWRHPIRYLVEADSFDGWTDIGDLKSLGTN